MSVLAEVGQVRLRKVIVMDFCDGVFVRVTSTYLSVMHLAFSLDDYEFFKYSFQMYLYNQSISYSQEIRISFHFL
jgi:hypothetical protein